MQFRRRAAWALVSLLCVALLTAPAALNGFPLLQYDTGGYLAPWYDHVLRISRSVPYGLLLVVGRTPDFWPVVIVQSALTVWVLTLTLRAHGLGSPLMLLALTAMLCALTTLPWLTSVLLTDIFAGLTVFALYLLFLRDGTLNNAERIGLFALVTVGAATHSGTLAMLILLTGAGAAVRAFDPRHIEAARLAGAIAALFVAAALVFASDDVVAGKIAWTPGGPALSFGRMLQDGIVKKYLDAHCPDATLKLCPYKDKLPDDADDFFWGGGVFDKLGRFDGMNAEMRRIALGALVDYPLLQLQSMVTQSAHQLVEVETGAGVVNRIWNTYFTIKTFAPAAVPAMNAARQQHPGLSFAIINDVQVPVALIAMALLPLAAACTARRKDLADLSGLNAAAALAILANAAVFGTLATAHNRYGARMVWIAVLAVLITLARMALVRATRLAARKP